MRRPWAAGPSQAAALFPLFVRDVSDESGPWDPVCYKHKPGGEFLLPSFPQEKQWQRRSSISWLGTRRGE